MSQWRDISLAHNGKLENVAVELPPGGGSEEEISHYVRTLEENEQIQHEPGPLQPGKTHQIVTDDRGNKRLVQRRYSAI